MKIALDGAGPLTLAASPREASASPAPLEREQKRLLTRAQAQALLERVAPRAVLEIHDPALPVATTWTTYLDTDDLRFLASSRSGLARRVRIREYGASGSPDAPPVRTGVSVLEVKESADGRRRKLRFRSDREGIDRVLDGLRRGIVPSCADAVLAEIACALDGLALAPRVCTLYRRLTLAVAPRIRVTFDEDVRFYRPDRSDAAFGASEAQLGAISGVVVEVKGRGALPPWLSATLAGIAPVSDLSKFSLGLELLAHAEAQPRPPRHLPVSELPLTIPAALRRRVLARIA